MNQFNQIESLYRVNVSHLFDAVLLKRAFINQIGIVAVRSTLSEFSQRFSAAYQNVCFNHWNYKGYAIRQWNFYFRFVQSPYERAYLSHMRYVFKSSKYITHSADTIYLSRHFVSSIWMSFIIIILSSQANMRKDEYSCIVDITTFANEINWSHEFIYDILHTHCICSFVSCTSTYKII